MPPHRPGNTPRRAGETAQTGDEYPGRQWPLALVQQGSGEVVERALAALAPGACASGAIVVRAPAANVVALAARPLQWTVFSPERMDGGWALVGVEELMHMGEHRHG